MLFCSFRVLLLRLVSLHVAAAANALERPEFGLESFGGPLAFDVVLALIQWRPFDVLPSYSHARPASCSLASARNARPRLGKDIRTKAPERQTLRADLGRRIAVMR